MNTEKFRWFHQKSLGRYRSIMKTESYQRTSTNDRKDNQRNCKITRKIEELNAWLQNFAEENGYVYLNYYDSLRDDSKGLPKKFSEDGVHPNSTGHRIMETLAIKAIKKALSNQ